jgi:uncharacterized protein with HEPN domain
MPKRDSLVLLNDISTALGRISSYVQGMDKDAFLNDQKTIDAVTRNLEIVGEAASQMDEVIKNCFPDISWHRIVGLRHRIVHDYFGVDTSLIWGIATKDVEELANILRKHTSC